MAKGNIPEITSQSLMNKNTIKIGKSEVGPSNEIIETLVVVPPDGGWGWIVVLATFICNVVVDGTMYAFGIFLEDIALSIGCSHTEVALANSLMTGLYYLSGPITGAMVNRFGCKVVAVAGLLATSVAVLATSFCTDIIPIIVVYGVVGGIGLGMFYLSSTVAVGFYFERWRALAQSIAVCGSSTGITCFPIIFMMLLNNVHWRTKFRILAAALSICALCCMLYRPLYPVRIVSADDKRVQFVNDNESGASVYGGEAEGGLRGAISRYHNIGYPTTAELYGRSAIALTDPRRISASSVFIAASGPSTTTSKSSLRTLKSLVKSKTSTAKAKSSSDPLQTVYEEESFISRCQRCCRECKVFCSCASCCLRSQRMPARPLYRDDIFYTGSILQLPEYLRSGSSGASSVEVSTKQ